MSPDNGATFAVMAVAGRRIDSKNADRIRFPIANVEIVRARIKKKLTSLHINHVVCSAACGTDLLALSEACDLNIEYTVIIPFDIATFKQKSVDDRPGSWSKAFDMVIDRARKNEHLHVLRGPFRDDEDAFALVTRAIVRAAEGIAQRQKDAQLYGLIAWEGSARSGSDATEDFRRQTVSAGFTQVQIDTSLTL